MHTRAAAWLAWSLWVLTLALIGAPLLFESVRVEFSSPALDVLGALVQLAYATVGALIASRRPRNPLGWLLASSALLSVFANFAFEYAVYGLFSGRVRSPAPLGSARSAELPEPLASSRSSPSWCYSSRPGACPRRAGVRWPGLRCWPLPCSA